MVTIEMKKGSMTLIEKLQTHQHYPSVVMTNMSILQAKKYDLLIKVE